MMPSGGQMMNFRPYPMLMHAGQGLRNNENEQPTFCAFIPDSSHFPAYFEPTTTSTPSTVKKTYDEDRKYRKDGENHDECE
jgi:hypothetical protein